MNPGAPEFTPRSTAAPELINTSPIRSSWAEDVEEETGFPTTAPAVDVDSASISTAIRAYEASSSSKHDDAVSPVIPPESTVFDSPADPKPRRNTLQSVSCPDPSCMCFPDSPTRCVSQPVPPSPVVASSPKEDPKPPEEKTKDTPPSPEVKPPSQGSTRGRGGSRGRPRGRYRGGRARRRNPSGPKSDQKGDAGTGPRRGSSTSRAR